MLAKLRFDLLFDLLGSKSMLQFDAEEKVSDVLDWSALLRGKLYDRDAEKTRLVDRLDKIVLGDTVQNELVLLTGPSGNGKTVLAKTTLRPAISQLDGQLTSGKFDQLQKPESFQAFVQAFSQYAHRLEREGALRIAAVREKVLQAVGEEGQFLLMDMIPA
jgi:predicted ATPase